MPISLYYFIESCLPLLPAILAPERSGWLRHDKMGESTLLLRNGLLCCLLLAAATIFTADAHTTACNQGNNPLCLAGNATYEGLRGRLKNNGSYWFGEDYIGKWCSSDKDQMTDACLNPAPAYLTIIERMRMSHDTETDSVEQVLYVRYEKPAGSYMGCNGRVNVAAINKTIDAVHSIHEDSWTLSDRPVVTWQATANTKYTLVFWDAGWFEMQGLWINAPEGRLDNAEEVIPYTGPRNPYLRRNAYVFAVYKQANALDAATALSTIWNLRRADNNVALNKVVDHLNLTGPIGICPIVTQVDYHTAQMGRNMMIVNSCPAAQTYEIYRDRERRFTWMNKTDVTLTVSVDVTYHSPAFTEESCCVKQNIPGRMVKVSANLRDMVDPVATSAMPHVRLIPTNFVRDPRFYLKDSLFTLLFVDVTMGKDYADPTQTNLHWQVINIPKLNLGAGQTIVQWLGAIVVPHNSTVLERMYAFMLFKQPRSLTETEVRGYLATSGCPVGLNGRCKFNLASFRSDLGLTLVGMSGHKSRPDPWSRYKRYTVMRENKNIACRGVTNFQDPCPKLPKCDPVGAASLQSYSLAVLAMAAILSMLFRCDAWL